MKNYESLILNRKDWDESFKQLFLKDFIQLRNIIDNNRCENPDSKLSNSYSVLADDYAVLPGASYNDEIQNAYRYLLAKYNEKDI